MVDTERDVPPTSLSAWVTWTALSTFFGAEKIEGMSDITGTELGRMTTRGILQAGTVL